MSERHGPLRRIAPSSSAALPPRPGMCYGEGPMARSLLLAALLAGLLSPAAALAADPIGADSCRVCHPQAFDVWKDSPHARATASLTPKQQKDPRCLSCHSPEAAKGVPEVSCEACHGDGQFYAPRYVMKDSELARAVGLVDPTERLCLKCHDSNAPSLHPFRFEERLRRIDHWTEIRAARQAQRAATPPARGRKPPSDDSR
jgi:hypothetical protein